MLKLWENFLISVRREKLLILANMVAMTVTFLVLGLFISVAVVSQTILKSLEDQAQLTVFFKDDFNEENILALKDSLMGDPRVNSVKYISKEDAFKIFTDMNKDEPILLESVSKSILPASIEIKTKKLNDLSTFADDLGKKDGVEEVKFFKDVIEKFKTWSTGVYAVGVFLTILFLVVSYSIIVVTLRVTIHSKGQELEVMKLVGASDTYVKAPLIFQGLFLGFLSSSISSVVLLLIIFFSDVINVLPERLGLRVFFFSLPPAQYSVYIYGVLLSLVLIASGMVLGYVGSLSAIKKYLKY